MQGPTEVAGLREHYESIMRREAYKYQQQIDTLTRELEEEKKRSALLESELVQYLRQNANLPPRPLGSTSSSTSTSTSTSSSLPSPPPPTSLASPPYSSPPLSSSPLVYGDKSRVVSVNIIDAREMKEKEGGRKYHAYVINIQNVLGEGWTIYKRYRQFEVLHFLIVRRFGEHVPELPPKRQLIKQAEKIQKRKEGLQHYCNQLLAIPSLANFGPIIDFFKQPTAA
jgi:hypothetical protein